MRGASASATRLIGASIGACSKCKCDRVCALGPSLWSSAIVHKRRRRRRRRAVAAKGRRLRARV